MPITLNINHDYSAREESGGSKVDNPAYLYMGSQSLDKGFYYWRSAIKFPLTALPLGAIVTLVRFRIYVNNVGGSGHRADIHAFGGNGQQNPAVGSIWAGCDTGTPYITATDAFSWEQGGGEKWFDLTAELGNQVCIDVMNAKSAYDRFSLGIHEVGDNDLYCQCDTTIGAPSGIRLEITYTLPEFGGGLNPVQMAKIILDM